MKFRVERDVLADAVAWTARTLPVRPSVPVLAGMLLDAGEHDGQHRLKLSSFDYEVSAQVSVEIDVEEPGTTLVSGRLLAEITRNLPPQTVEISTDGAKVVVACGSAKFTLLTLPVEDYPTLPDMPQLTGSVGSDAFAAAVSQVAVAAGRDDTLPMLTGVRVEIEGETVTLASTDRYRLAVRELTWKPENPELSAVALVPAKTLADTAKSLTTGAEVSIALSAGKTAEGMIGFSGGGRRTTTRLLDGDFPKYRALLPDTFNSVAEVQKSEFIEAVKRVSLVAERNTPLRLAFSDGQLVLEAGTGDEAQAVEVLEAGLEGDDIQIAFNSAFLLDGLNAIDSDIARLQFTTSTKPAIITGKPAEDGADADYRYLIMPVRLSS
ncbi:DNA polymerase III subunit beta [Marinitenerispora sediminis]|uniref:Beta sliding clamp n=1 Tax=Marinitenerispora sediminis TaxID=1931232 RepID=A0A368TAA4_9ACTN|nr:DNA polymerase III subunit beta [Marinitenerispora sediminis]RCV53962.1 DNA polymerase III subunit beta [Marinitenerispora sediminis]RCV60487.1 DNA polymerase III subunit beta [Marinitenerispora sediminis]RCV61832.1 DNA polymerase III subunit beta [Marinitenerispora sediminis]